MNIAKHPDSYGLKTRGCLSILTAVVLEQFVSCRPRVHVHVCVCVYMCVFLPGHGSDSLILSLDSNELWPGKCLGFGFPGLKAMANKLGLLSLSESQSKS